jgi:hypothetical protein
MLEVVVNLTKSFVFQPFIIMSKTAESPGTRPNKNSQASVQNWMKSVEFAPAVYVEAESVEQVQSIVRNVEKYPSPVRPAGNVLSPSNVHLNDKGTTIVLRKMNKIHGLVKIPVSDGHDLTCVDCDAGCTLRKVQIYAHQHGLELPFSAEIGLSTIGGTAFATTKDSAIGKSPVESMGIGDVGSMLYKISIVEQDGELRDYVVMDHESGVFDPYFQRLLDSYGTRGIAVRALVTTRPKTPLTTTLHIAPLLRREDHQTVAENILKLRARAARLDGNVFAIIGWHSKICILEERIPADKQYRFAPLSFILAPFLVWLKKFLFQRCIVPAWFHILRLISGTFLLRFHQSSRSPGNHYTMDVPKDARKLTFSYYAFDEKDLTRVVKSGLDFTADYEQKNRFAPAGFAIYFVSHSGKRLAGPYANRTAEREVSFSFDPIHHSPNDEEWLAFCQAFNQFAKDHGGRPSLNQTLGLEKDASYGGTAVHGEPCSRFTSVWLQQFYNHREDDEPV